VKSKLERGPQGATLYIHWILRSISSPPHLTTWCNTLPSMDHSGTNSNPTLPNENVGVGCSYNSTAISSAHVWGGQAMYRAIDWGRDANLPPLYIAYSPAIVQHSPTDWHTHNNTSAIRSSPQVTNSLNHIPFPTSLWILSWLSVKPYSHRTLLPLDKPFTYKTT